MEKLLVDLTDVVSVALHYTLDHTMVHLVYANSREEEVIRVRLGDEGLASKFLCQVEDRGIPIAEGWVQ